VEQLRQINARQEERNNINKCVAYYSIRALFAATVFIFLVFFFFPRTLSSRILKKNIQVLPEFQLTLIGACSWGLIGRRKTFSVVEFLFARLELRHLPAIKIDALKMFYSLMQHDALSKTSSGFYRP
jgi:hypothetical protein